ncbi:CRAL-TRIO domain-containing protein [Infundibulicybe gibba]|nr:CRAL-TRIO domain-containing protein [Infundibulicybe gibba]
MDVQLLQANCDRLLDQYHSNLQNIVSLQTTLLRDILPSIADELQLNPDATEWAKEWLLDTSTMFRMSRRHRFTRSFAMEYIRKTLVWRLAHLWPLAPPILMPMLHCLPGTVRDPLGRPILIIEVVPFNESSDAVKHIIIQAIERLRSRLQRFSESCTKPVLQYIVLLDLKRLSFQKINIELISWTLREVMPRFPGMLAAAFMINCSFAHRGMWSVIKRVLPASALSRVFFPTADELLQYLTPSALPQDYGGTLPLLKDLRDCREMPPTLLQTTASTLVIPNHAGAPQPQPTYPSPPDLPTIVLISPTSYLNPFFGYPVSSARGFVSLPHGRRRKRDLAKTLARLLWLRWRAPIILTLQVILLAILIRLGVRRRLMRFQIMPLSSLVWTRALVDLDILHLALEACRN